MKKSFLFIAFLMILGAVLIFPFAINVDKAGAEAIMSPWKVEAAQGNPDVAQSWMKNPKEFEVKTADYPSALVMGMRLDAVLATRSAPLTPAWGVFTLTEDTKLVRHASKLDGLAVDAVWIAMTTVKPDYSTLSFVTKWQDGYLRTAFPEMITGDGAYGGRFTGSAQMDGTFHAMKMKAAGAMYAMTTASHYYGSQIRI